MDKIENYGGNDFQGKGPSNYNNPRQYQQNSEEYYQNNKGGKPNYQNPTNSNLNMSTKSKKY